MPVEASIDLPPPPEASGTFTAAGRAAADWVSMLDGMEVLVVDDHACNRELVRMICGAFGVRVTEADGGVQALEAARARAFDVILMDIRMPDIEGDKVTATLRGEAGPNQNARIVAFSATCAGHVLRTTQGLFDAAFAKPFAPRDLLTTLATQRALAA